MEFSPSRQFTIRTLFLVVAGVGVLLAIGKLIGALWSAILLWLGAMVAAHLAGAVIGHRRRSRLSEQLMCPRPFTGSAAATEDPAVARAPEQLTQARPLAPWVRHLTAGGAIVGMLGGLAAMWFLTDGSLNGLLLGAISSAVLGGFFAFLATSFLAIALNAFGEANAEPALPQIAPSRERPTG